MNLLVDNTFNFRFFFGCHRLRMGKVEAEPFCRNIGSFLLNMIAEYHPQRLVQKVRCSVVCGCLFGVIRQAALKNLLAAGAGELLMLFKGFVKFSSING